MCSTQAIGLAIIGVGSYLVNQGHDLNFFTGNRVITAAVLLIVCGVILFLITALGVAAAFFQHKLGLYIVRILGFLKYKSNHPHLHYTRLWFMGCLIIDR